MKVVAIDPGQETGVVSAVYIPEESRVSVLAREQIVGGYPGLRGALEEYEIWADHAVCEKFSPLPTARAYRLAELEPIRIEGAVEDRFGPQRVTFQRTSALTIAGSHGNPAANKKAADDYLRDCGLWTTGKVVGRRDANDVNAAMKHLVAYGRANNWPDPHDWKMD